VQAGVVYVDGLTVGDIDRVILRDRQKLSQGGIISATAVIDHHDGKVVREPELVLRGVAGDLEDEQLLADARERLGKALAKMSQEGVTDRHVVEKRMHDVLGQLIWERTRSRPMIVPVVVEV
jgi:ribonuclease J